ncbi:MAG TPA: hypothetical protein PK997_04035 [Candidatus Omnitrophota bacterium]|jgi:uncharacterized protein YceK|nr:MAG: hypothetical protein BWY49_00243 [Candidatus Omnitrophica bacterium ADurb.Bin314]HOE68317.1 hypothetical protein [Candidatus Omnitrophota bacterium]HPW64569.1 hypothetical protein [Candidatus Omnitrophota bacterium]HQB94362.1 hypothetical protein [Candidatus Omnitrophota bacterium]
MMKKILMCVAVLACLYLPGCSSVHKVLPVHDEVLLYNKPYDLTYMNTLMALNAKPGWELESTDKEKGLITVRNTEYTRFDDADKRVISILVKRVDREQTSVSLAPDSRQRLSSGEIIDWIGDRLPSDAR